jgi:hypothetical protein
MPIQLPALGIQAPQQPDVLGQVAKMRQIQGMGQEQQFRAQQIEMQAQKLKDTKIVTALYAQNGGDLDKTVSDAAKAGVTPETLQGLQQHAITMKNQALQVFKNQGEIALQQADLMAGAHKSVDDAPAKYKPAVWQQQLMGLSKAGVDVSQLPVQYPGDEQFKMIGLGIQGYTKQLDIAAKQSEAAKNTAQAAQANAEAGLKNQETEFYKGNGMGAPGVPPEVAQMSDALKRGVIKNPSEWPAYKAKQDAIATAPQKIAVARAEGEARASIEAQVARGSNAALATVPPHLVAPASAQAAKVGEDYAQAQSVTQRLNAMMDAARKGNVVAYQVMPEEGTLQITTSQGVHRINQAEIQQYAGGGSLWQRLMGHVGKTLSGKSIPDSVLDDMADIQKIQSEGSQLKYNNALKTINQTYGAKFEPVQMDDMKSVQGSGAKKGAGDPLGIR